MSRTAGETGPAAREALLGRLAEIGGFSAMFSATVAARVGINTTDLESLDLLRRHGPMTAGRLAKLTGLTTGAITGVIDRLERRGYARREADPSDRRRVIVRVNDDIAAHDLGPLYAELETAMMGVLTRYSDEEIAILSDVAGRLSDAMRDAVARLRRP
ncbi:MAG: MarR family transcriptional regulator [Thermomicrobiales bacterium]